MKRILRFFTRWLPEDHPLRNEVKLQADRKRVNVSIARYHDLSEELKEVIEKDNFANYLKYEGAKPGRVTRR